MTALQCELDRHIVMRSSSCELNGHIVMRSSSCELNGQIVMRSSSCDSKFIPPKRRFWKERQRGNPDFRSPFQGVSTRFGLRTIEKYIENLDFIFCQSFHNLRLGEHKVELDLHIAMRLRDACAFNMQGFHERSLTRLACTLFNTAGMHAL
jgi:hypothetical protein